MTGSGRSTLWSTASNSRRKCQVKKLGFAADVMPARYGYRGEDVGFNANAMSASTASSNAEDLTSLTTAQVRAAEVAGKASNKQASNTRLVNLELVADSGAADAPRSR